MHGIGSTDIEKEALARCVVHLGPTIRREAQCNLSLAPRMGISRACHTAR
jgi:hypothetical protein